MKIIKRITAMIMAVSMLFMLAVNVFAADPIVCREYSLNNCAIEFRKDLDVDDWTDGNYLGMVGRIYIIPTIEEQGIASGVYEYGISDVDAAFTLYVPTLDFFEENKILTDNVSAVITIRIDYNVPYGRTNSVSYSIRQNIPKLAFTGSGHDGHAVSSAYVHFSIPDMITIDKSYLSTKSITASVDLYPNEGTPSQIGLPYLFMIPVSPNETISMSKIISENT